MTVKELVTTAIYLAVIVALQMLLVPLPNIQLTTLLFVLYFTFNKKKNSIILIISYSTVMGLFWGYTIWLIPMAVSWLLALVIFETFKTTDEYKLGFKSIFMAIVLGWTYGLFSWVVFSWSLTTFLAYMTADIIFEILMASSNYLSIILLYPRLSKILKSLGW